MTHNISHDKGATQLVNNDEWKRKSDSPIDVTLPAISRALTAILIKYGADERFFKDDFKTIKIY